MLTKLLPNIFKWDKNQKIKTHFDCIYWMFFLFPAAVCYFRTATLNYNLVTDSF